MPDPEKQSQASHDAELRQALTAILGPALAHLLAEMAFADAWSLDSVRLGGAPSRCDRWCLLPVRGDWTGSLLLGCDAREAARLAAGYYSLPDHLVDEGTSLEFLAELGGALVRELGRRVGVGFDVRLQEPRLPQPDEIEGLLHSPSAGRAALGCNEDGVFVGAVSVDA